METRHVVVAQEKGVFHGWPANHGAWQWGDEFLVGLIRGEWAPKGVCMHQVVGTLYKVQARSLDGGETWVIEQPNVDFEGSTPEPAPEFSLQDSIIRVCGGYDHGGEFVDPRGAFYLSSDRGKTWSGSYLFDGLTLEKGTHNTSRTRVLGNKVFMSAAMVDHWGTDWVFMSEHDGKKFTHVADVAMDDYRAVMPAVAKLGNRIVVTCRRRGSNRRGGWIDSYFSDDDGRTWSEGGEVGVTGTHNGNPPALIEHEGILYCVFGNRSSKEIRVAVSDNGEDWSGYRTLIQGKNTDFGYPQLFKRNDGKLVCVYYWSDDPEDHQRIQATIFE